MKIANSGFLCIGLAVMAGCGTPGAPMPPSLNLPQPVKNLSAVRKGEKVTLAWTQPPHTTDNTVAAKHIGITRVCRSLTSVAPDCSQPVGEVTIRSGPAGFTDTIQPVGPYSNAALPIAHYVVEVMNERRRSAGVSNPAEIALAYTWPPPDRVEAKATAEGIVISWSGISPLSLPGTTIGYPYYFRVLRLSKGLPAATAVADIPVIDLNWPRTRSVMDKSFEWEKSYTYRVVSITKLQGDAAQLAKYQGEIEGDNSPAVEIFAHDIFPPATPSAMQAVFSGNSQQPFIDLTWAQNTENDLAGYNVYRQEEGSQAARINSELIKTSAFRDNNVQPGHKYFYTVTAVDLRNNESPKSEETSESVPQ